MTTTILTNAFSLNMLNISLLADIRIVPLTDWQAAQDLNIHPCLTAPIKVPATYVVKEIATMKLYEGTDFFFVEKDGVWYETPIDGEDSWEKIPAIKHPGHQGLVEKKLDFIKLPKFLTDCDICDNKGYRIGQYEEDTFVCDCYHGLTHGERDLEEELLWDGL